MRRLETSLASTVAGWPGAVSASLTRIVAELFSAANSRLGEATMRRTREREALRILVIIGRIALLEKTGRVTNSFGDVTLSAL
jgi:hypothetical protein